MDMMEVVVNTEKIMKTVNVSYNMAQKYKSGYSLPPLDKAVKMEDELHIPVRYWLELKRRRLRGKK